VNQDRRHPGPPALGRDVSVTQLAASKIVGRSSGGRSRALDVDHYVSLRIRQRRIMLGLTQQQMAELIGVTYQQAHKYENGVNRIAAGRLYTIAQVLGVDVGYFFEGLQGAGPREPSPQQRVFLDLARNFRSIRKPKHQEAICLLARILATVENPSDIDAWDMMPDLA
jgi:transcriptional regulator with XRE-family HTH domain